MFGLFKRNTTKEPFKFKLNENKKGFILTKYSGKDAEVVVPGTYQDYPVVGVGEDAFSVMFSKVESICLPNSIKTIGDSAFHACDKLRDIKLPPGLVSIDESAFNLCLELKSIEIPKGVTKLPKSVFKKSGLTEIAIPKSIKSIDESAFEGCSDLKNIVFHDDAKLMKVGASAFKNCGLTEVILPKSIKEIGDNAFAGCIDLKKVVFSPGTTDVKIADNAFEWCDELCPESISDIQRYKYMQMADKSANTNNPLSVDSSGLFREITAELQNIIENGALRKMDGFFTLSSNLGESMDVLELVLPYLKQPENEKQIANFMLYYLGESPVLASTEFPLMGYLYKGMLSEGGWICTNKRIYTSDMRYSKYAKAIEISKIKKWRATEDTGCMTLVDVSGMSHDIRVPHEWSGLFGRFHQLFNEMSVIIQYLIDIQSMRMTYVHRQSDN